MSDQHGDDGGYGDDRPLYSRRRRTILRVTVLVCVAALVLPGILSILSHYTAFAQAACWQGAHYSDPRTITARASFEVFGAGGIGWECYATTPAGEHHVYSMGLFPVRVTLTDAPTDRARSGIEPQAVLTVATGASADHPLGRQLR